MGAGQGLRMDAFSLESHYPFIIPDLLVLHDPRRVLDGLGLDLSCLSLLPLSGTVPFLQDPDSFTAAFEAMATTILVLYLC